MGRLIDEDKLMQDVNNTITEKSGAIDWINLINRQPTAYNPDKVVEQLEEFRPEMEQFGCGGMLTDIIDVVKAGGADAEY